ncbi:MAG: nitroreductase family protein [Thermoguttaceae bacterium]
MSEIRIDRYSCVRCGQCVFSCPSMLFTRSNVNECPVTVEGAEELCISCAHCVASCPVGAITVDGITSEMCQVVPKQNVPRYENVSTLVRTRRSVRHFSNKVLEEQRIVELLDAVRWAPTARNGLPLKWIVVNGHEKVRALAEMVVNAMRKNPKFERVVEAWEKGVDVVLRGSSTLIIAYANNEAKWGAVDGTIAVTTLDLCATAMRLGTCWAGYFIVAAQNEPEIAKWLGLAPDEKVQAALMVGYPGPEVYNKIPYRKEAEVRWIF